MKELTVLMPCLNEAETLENCIARAKKLLNDYEIDGEILISDNGSSDGSQQIAEMHGANVVNCPIRGYGAALQFGIENAQGKYILMADSDDSYHFDEAFPMIQKLREGYDVCMGTRLKGKIMPKAMPPLHRYLGNPVLTTIGKVLFNIKQSDFHCGMRAFRKDKILQTNLVTMGMEWASEMVIKACLTGLKITEVPITLYKDGRSRPPHLRSWRDGWRHLRFMLLHAPTGLFIIPGLLMLLIGFIGELVLVNGPMKIGGVVFDVHSLVTFAFLVVLGVQVSFTGAFAKLFSFTSGILPEDKSLMKLLDRLTLERLLIGFVILGITGISLFLFALGDWYSVGFQNLDYEVTMRKVIPSLTLIVCAIQGVFNSFMMSLLFLKTKSCHGEKMSFKPIISYSEDMLPM